ncbi:unnamed protein product [Rotaria sp. Silwood2]|nr:unnamed protein product [Rotaria sp. Silwood2]CAF2883720.1 unnamed protein product [Rotaria sp. Silwood2]CAF3849501.1 unnamed protein product [Rotaria sp. Silwood2]CAF4332635.1 unnamed protein product [Rotaria sp. Silwood2]
MNDPLNLTEIGIRYLSNYLIPIVSNQNIYLSELSCLSSRLGNLLLKTIVNIKRLDSSDSTDYFLSLFNNIGQKKRIKSEVIIQLSELYFRSCAFITNQSISKYLLSHELIETIDLRDCNITYEIFHLLTDYFPRLTTLYVGQTENKINGKINLIDFFPTNNVDIKCLLIKPKLKYLSLEGIHNTTPNDLIEEIFYHSLIQSSEQIRYVDLSRNSAIENLSYIDCFKQIHSLILYDILPNVIESSIDLICCLSTLVVLDLSFNRRIQESQNYSRPTITLAKLIRSLPKLLSLDISGTNLAGAFSFDQNEELNYIKKELSIDENENFTIQSSIAGLLLLKHELEFLGLFDVDEKGSARRWLPAKKITGEHTEQMIMTSLSYYMERPSMLTHIMAHLFRLYNHYTIQNPYDAGKLVMDGMEKHLYDRSLQTSGSACLYYVVDLFQNESDIMLEKYNNYLKRLLITILNAMNAHLQHSPMIRNGLLTISRMQMHVPNHIMSAFEQTVIVLIKFIQLYLNECVVHEQILLHNALSVLNHVACSVDGQEKLFIGQAGAIETAVGIIRRFLIKKTSCEIVEVAWTLLWNITDETAENCRRFIEDNNGLQTFHDCLDLWSDKRDLVRNMLGLLGNVAEVKELRHYLVNPSHMEKFRILLKRSQDNEIEIPYNCGGVLANILSDGIEAWTISSSIEQHIVNQEIYDSVQTWDLRRQRTINYRSLAPILRLLNENYSTGCIMWAVWAMTNLTTVLPEKYCTLVRNENGEPLLSQILHSDKVSEPIRNLAQATLANVQRFYDAPVPMDIGPNDGLEI